MSVTTAPNVRMAPNDLLSQELQVKPLKEGEVVEYMLFEIDSVSNRFTEDGKPIPVMPKCIALSSQTNIKDPEKGTVVIGNISEYAPKNNPLTGETQLIPKYVPPVFTGMSMFVRHDQFELYQYMERRPDNGSNPFRDKTKRAKFFRVDPMEDMRKAIANADLEDDALFIVKESDLKELLAIVDTLPTQLKASINPEGPIEEIRFGLRNLAKNGNAVAILKASQDQDAQLKIQLLEAEAYREIKRDTKTREWKYRNGKVICKVDAGTDMVNALLLHMKTKEGSSVYKEIVDFLMKIKSANA